MDENNKVQNIDNETIENLNESQPEKVKIEFPYSEVVRHKIPKAFDIAENVATQWKNQEKVESVGFEHPLAETIAVKALEKAKNVEKKLEEKGVVSAAKMGFAIPKMQMQSLVDRFKK